MRFLVVCPYNVEPPFSGGPTRIHGMATALRDEGVTVIAPAYSTIPARPHAPPTPWPYEMRGPRQRWTQLVNPWLVVAGVKLARRERPEFIIAASYAAALNALAISVLTRTPLIFDEFNVEHERFLRMGRPRLATVVRRYERWIGRCARFVTCVSEEDRQRLVETGIEEHKLLVVPNGYDASRFFPDLELARRARARLNVEEGTKVVLFFGKLDYGPNRAAATTIIEDIAPRFASDPHVTFVLAGPNPPAGELPPNVKVLGAVGAIEDVIRAADVVLAPLSAGGGTKLKIVEALACGKVIVTTPTGAEGIPPCPQLRVGRSTAEVSRLLEEALPEASYASAVLCDAIGSFTWEAAVEPLRGLQRSSALETPAVHPAAQQSMPEEGN